MLNKTLLSAAAVGLTAVAGSASAYVVTVQDVTGHNGGNWAGTLGHLTDMLNGNGSNDFGSPDHLPSMTVVDPDDPTTWTYAGSGWPQEWLTSDVLNPLTSINGKITWAVLDFGSDIAGLESAVMWNNSASVVNATEAEHTNEFNLYYAADGATIDALPATPNSGSSAGGDYNFQNGDWQQIGGTSILPYLNGNNVGPQGTFSLGGVTARYLAIEILSAGLPTYHEVGDGTNKNAGTDRVGLGQIEITAIPEPGSLALLGLGGLLVARRRRG